MRRLSAAVPLLLPLLLASCAPRPDLRTDIGEGEAAERRAIMAYAATLVGRADLRPLGGTYKNDCSGFVNGVYAASGRRIAHAKLRRDRSLAESLYLTLEDRGLAQRERPPNLADAVFFRNTYDTPYNGVTHVGLVERVDGDGTVTVIHYGSGRVGRIVMNLRHPDLRVDGRGKVINDYVRRGGGGRPRKDFLAGRLFHSYGDLYRHTGR